MVLLRGLGQRIGQRPGWRPQHSAVTAIHGDFAEWNVHYRHGRLAGVIDFGLTRGGWPRTALEETAIQPVYRAFRLDMAAWELQRQGPCQDIMKPGFECAVTHWKPSFIASGTRTDPHDQLKLSGIASRPASTT